MIPIEPSPQQGRSKALSETAPVLDQLASDQGPLEEFQEVFEEEVEKSTVTEFERFVAQDAVELSNVSSSKLAEQTIEIATEAAPKAFGWQQDASLKDSAGGTLVVGSLGPERSGADADRLVSNASIRTELSAGVNGIAEMKVGGRQELPLQTDAPKGNIQELRSPETAVTTPLVANEKAADLRSAQIASPSEVNGRHIYSAATAAETMALRTAMSGKGFTGQLEQAVHGNVQSSGTVERGHDRAFAWAEGVPTSSSSTKPLSYAASPTAPIPAGFGELSMLREGVGSMDLSQPKVGVQEAGPFASQDSSNRPVLNSLPQAALPPVVQNASVSQQVAMQISLQVGNARKSEIELRLEPEELGKVRIVLMPRDMGMTLSIVAERPETLELLRRNADQLLADLGGMDLGNASLEFSGGEREWAAQEELSPSDIPDEQITSVTVTSAGTIPGRLDIRL